MSDSHRLKIDLTLATDAEITALVGQFEACTLPYENWTHRAHVAVALHYLNEQTPAEALKRLRTHIQQFNNRVGDPAGYHETITCLFVQKVSAYLLKTAKADLPVAVNELAASCDLNWMLTFYSKDRLWSSEARSEWLEPDLRKLDF